jgi:murein DD-endopeptidase MepM/ murein hydrolase activator NlpD
MAEIRTFSQTTSQSNQSTGSDKTNKLAQSNKNQAEIATTKAKPTTKNSITNTSTSDSFAATKDSKQTKDKSTPEKTSLVSKKGEQTWLDQGAASKQMKISQTQNEDLIKPVSIDLRPYINPNASAEQRQANKKAMVQLLTNPSEALQNEKTAQDKGFIFTSGFGARWGRMHKGIDIGHVNGSYYMTKTDQKVATPFTGKVISNIDRNARDGAGNFVVIDTGKGIKVKVFHLDDDPNIPAPRGERSYTAGRGSKFKVGETIKAGQFIGLIGNTGKSKGAHIHFEMYGPDGKAIDPLNFDFPAYLEAYRTEDKKINSPQKIGERMDNMLEKITENDAINEFKRNLNNIK